LLLKRKLGAMMTGAVRSWAMTCCQCDAIFWEFFFPSYHLDQCC
jgi:hypothetical protein